MSARKHSSRIMAALCGGASLMALAYAHPAMAQADQPAASSGGGLEEVVVTARRKEEKAQTVPIALTTFNQAAIETQAVRAIADLDKDTPGITICCNREAVYNIWVRGVPGAVAYFNEVPLINFNGYALFFDTGSFQVLKGPQGTLFGQAADGGAILYESKPAVNDFEGSVEGNIGDYNHRESQFILNIPVVENKLLVRVGGQYDHTDGYVKDLTTGVETGSENYWIARLTATFRPTDDIQNDFFINFYSSSNTGSAVPTLAAINPKGIFPLLYGPAALTIVPQQQALGRYAFIGGEPLPGGERMSTNNYTIINTTRWDVSDNLTIKNILGYQEITPGPSVYSYANGVPYPQFPLSAASYALLNSHPLVPDNQLVLYTEELQLQGKLFDDLLSYTVGTFNDVAGTRQPVGPIYRAGLGRSIAGTQSWGDGRTNAVYGQGTYDLSAFVDGLSFTGGYRYTWDKQYLTSLSFSAAGVMASHISQLGHFKAASYTMSLDYQIDPTTLLYVTNAKGYSKGGFNGGNAAVVSGISTYQPESLNNVEVGVKTDNEIFGVKTRTNLSAYYGFYDNVQGQQGISVPSPIPGNPPSLVVITSNAATAHIEGVDGELTIVPTDSTQIHAAAEYIITKYDTWTGIDAQAGGVVDDLSISHFIYTPMWKYTIDATYRLPIDESLGQLSFTANYSWIGVQHALLNRLDDFEDDVPKHDNLDMSLNWRNIMGRSGLDGRAYVTNVLENLWTNGNCLCYDKTSLGAASRSISVPRQWGVAVRYSFGP